MIRAALAVAAAAWCIAAAVAATGGFSFRLAGLPVRSHSPLPAAVVAVICTVIVMLAPRERRRAALTWWWGILEHRAALGAAMLAIVAVVIGIRWGTFAAGGSDSYCYLNQAELFARGAVHDYEPLGADPSWPGPAAAFVPAGHSAVPSRMGAMAPICPAGYPVMLAAAKLVLGRDAMFWITPLMGALLVWLTFVVGRRIGGAPVGLLAALLLLTSPIFIYQVVQPMNDVVATALWCAALAAALGPAGGVRAAAVAGLLAGAALTVRPNLLPLAAVIGAWIAFRDGHLSMRAALSFGAALAPGVAFVLAAQAAMYGSPLRSGYGDLSALFSASHVLPNLARYPRWVLEAQTPLVVLAAAAPWMLSGSARRAAWWLLAFIAAVFACYLPYVVFDEWWYQRFVLPALPPLLVLTAVPLVRLVERCAVEWRPLVFAAMCAVLAATYLGRASQRDAFRLQDYERRFRSAGEYVAGLPRNAAIVTVHQSGSVRFYSGRTTVLWEEISPGRLGETIDYLRHIGRKPYLLLEGWEESRFRARFTNEPLGSLAWPPAADIDRVVRLYDPDDYPRYMRGEYVATDRVVTRR